MSSAINPYDPPLTPPPEEKFSDQGGAFAAATSVRYRIIALTVAMSVLLYLDRFSIGPVTSTILKEMNWRRDDFGWAMFFFFVTYALFQVPSAWICDRFGSRVALPVYVLAWSLVTMLLGLSNSLIMVFILRLLLGAAQAGAYPAAAGYIKKWVPLEGRAGANGLTAMGGRAGSLLAFSLTGPIALLIGGMLGISTGQWRFVFVLYGLLGFIWAALFYWQFRERPEEHPASNPAEAALASRAERTAKAQLAHDRLTAGIKGPSFPDTTPASRLDHPLIRMLFSPNVWLLSLSGFFVNVGWIFLVAWNTVYISEKYEGQIAAFYGADLNDPAAVENALKAIAGPLTALPLLAGVLGCVTGGALADRLLRRFGRIWGRRIPGLFSATLVTIGYFLALFVNDLWLFIGLMAAISFFIDLGLGALWATYQDIGGKNVGSVLGFANMCGNLGAAACGTLIGYIAQARQWHWVFIISSCSFLVVLCCWSFVNPTRPVVPRGDD